MPGYKGHIAGGLVAYGIGAYIVYTTAQPSAVTLVEWAVCTLAGSLFPDIDTKSKGQKLFYSALAIIMIILFARGCYDVLAVVGMLALVPILTRHRGLFHKPWFIISFALGVAYGCSVCIPSYAQWLWYDAIFFIIGALSHIWLDIGLRRMFRM